MNVASRCISLGEEKGFFPVLIDGDIDNNDGMAKKSAISVLRKEVIEAYLSRLKLLFVLRDFSVLQRCFEIITPGSTFSASTL